MHVQLLHNLHKKVNKLIHAQSQQYKWLKKYEVCSKLTMTIPGVTLVFVDFEHVLYLFLAFWLLTLNRYTFAGK